MIVYKAEVFNYFALKLICLCATVLQALSKDDCSAVVQFSTLVFVCIYKIVAAKRS